MRNKININFSIRMMMTMIIKSYYLVLKCLFFFLRFFGIEFCSSLHVWLENRTVNTPFSMLVTSISQKHSRGIEIIKKPIFCIWYFFFWLQLSFEVTGPSRHRVRPFLFLLTQCQSYRSPPPVQYSVYNTHIIVNIFVTHFDCICHKR